MQELASERDCCHPWMCHHARSHSTYSPTRTNFHCDAAIQIGNTQPLNRPGPQPWRPKTPINRTLVEQGRHVPVRNVDQGWSADAR
eukprot:354857-Chlamydomonas_euryale.AAC.54